MNKTRRSIVKTLASGIVAIPVFNLLAPAQLLAADNPKLNPDDPAAKSLNYTHASADAAKRCSGCQFYTGASGDDWGHCVIFPGLQVNASGLCNSWFARAG